MGIFSLLDYGVRTYGGAGVLVVLVTAALIINTKVTRRNADQWWRDHVEEFAPEKALKMIARRDAKIEALERKAAGLEAERRSLIDAVRAGATYADRTREILTQPEVVRIRETERRSS